MQFLNLPYSMNEAVLCGVQAKTEIPSQEHKELCSDCTAA